MTTSAARIPAWNIAGVLPPIRPSAPGSSPDRSPYVVDLAVLFDRFATSPERMAILDGLLRFRADLHAAGITSGFQWLDGSFLEQVEALESRAPRDMDVVTFLDLPQGLDQRALAQRHRTLFDQKHAKATYAMDAFRRARAAGRSMADQEHRLLVQPVVAPSRRAVEGVCTG